MCNRKIQWPTIKVWWQKKRYCSDMPSVCLQLTELHMRYKYHPMNPNKNILSANQFLSLIDMKRKFINSDNHKFHQYQ